VKTRWIITSNSTLMILNNFVYVYIYSWNFIIFLSLDPVFIISSQCYLALILSHAQCSDSMQKIRQWLNWTQQNVKKKYYYKTNFLAPLNKVVFWDTNNCLLTWPRNLPHSMGLEDLLPVFVRTSHRFVLSTYIQPHSYILFRLSLFQYYPPVYTHSL
jgi:hypothetical protein